MALFRAKNATAGDTAQRLRELGLSDSVALRGMVLASVVRKAGADRYFLDEQAWARRRNLTGSLALRVGVALALVVLAAVLYAIAGR